MTMELLGCTSICGSINNQPLHSLMVFERYAVSSVLVAINLYISLLSTLCDQYVRVLREKRGKGVIEPRGMRGERNARIRLELKNQRESPGHRDRRGRVKRV